MPGSLERVCLFFFRKLPYGLPRLLCHFALSPAVDDTSYCITSCWQCSGFGHSDRCIEMSYCCFDSHFPDDTSCEAFFSCVYLSSVYILWWGVFWSLWPIFFLLCHLFSYSWVFRVSLIFWIKVLCPMYLLYFLPAYNLTSYSFVIVFHRVIFFFSFKSPTHQWFLSLIMT